MDFIWNSLFRWGGQPRDAGFPVMAKAYGPPGISQ